MRISLWRAREFTNNLGSSDQAFFFVWCLNIRDGGYDRRWNERHVMGTVTLRRTSLVSHVAAQNIRCQVVSYVTVE